MAGPTCDTSTRHTRPESRPNSTCIVADENTNRDDHYAVSDLTTQQDEKEDSRLQQWEDLGHQFEAGELELLKRSIAQMALSRIDGQDELFVGGLWALRRSDSLTDRRITHVLSLVPFNPSALKNFKDEPWIDYGKDFRHLVIDIDDVDDADLLIELPKAVRFIEEGLRASRREDGVKVEDAGDGGVSLEKGVEDLNIESNKEHAKKERGGVFVHCAAGKSSPRRIAREKDTAQEAVHAALTFVRRTRPMAEPNPGFMDQLALWWEMGCPDDVEAHPVYQRWAYKREVEENLAINQAPTRLRFEDEETQPRDESGVSLRCKKCRRTLVTAPFIIDHRQPDKNSPTTPCQHFFVEPLSWMRSVLEKGELNGRLLCPNAKCGAGVGRYDWKGFRCSCGGWVTPAFSLQRARVDDEVKRPVGLGASQSMGIRMPPGAAATRSGNFLNKEDSALYPCITFVKRRYE
ncbi:hypothetical protein CEP52_010014 [Fusarium oligoseptatum]|uniref:protein-tyrosine-phosphatase n=1 Tax=Fusarium oligoseptatum TaxID=2604345 RepID=A0A428TA68_9HYPO|nr:hypothetical protein CEP52_010014 [Fusarium oligoseptatum]